jgi:hypothetical protein
MKRGLVCLLLVVSGAGALAQTAPAKSLGQNLYLPIYSHIWHGDMNKLNQPEKTLVSVSVSIRNTDPAKSIRILSAKYFDTHGKKLREYVTAPLSIGPMGTHELFVPRSDDTGGSGANFVIAWQSDKPANPPIVEGFHANMPVGRTIAFSTSAVPMADE